MEDNQEPKNRRRWLLVVLVIAIALGLFYLAYGYLYAKLTVHEKVETLTVEHAGNRAADVAEAAELEGGVVVKIDDENTILTVESFGITFDFPGSWTIDTSNGAKIDWRLSGTTSDEPADLEMRLVQTNGSTKIFPKYIVRDTGVTSQTITLLDEPYYGYRNAYIFRSTVTQKWLKYAFKLYQPAGINPWVIFTFRSDQSSSTEIKNALTDELTLQGG
ncbi:hypothetical protein A3A71_03960 [Candidatus Berkelbacteria bacterium RIFCSPLOWO2_01_FULL_50_28]|uniref:Uncharacterized protein n=1 Tax=Candidatus Berkelbacteria bacterium RIFCSPLOWO2_01_FULL_50_28 TaxID=1797471 RepID=A0A1F5EA92_9BACT|nr:MAG: hypothetical protein A3F39_01325 [Candidatus Berkelbacteria bacterium RIFCSPHIGHO2_12_FULL_50_11]OGD64295.1 MAG: hypothetical protein A3A71_03960 [Candidatus Berkelbacteria bacterium RIFCSPLOWO2_01_FULL_50_28]